MRMRNYLRLTGLAFFYATSGLAQEPANTYVSANFPTDQSELISRIEFPEYRDDILVRVFCDAELAESGKLGTSICWSNHEDARVFTNAVEKNFDLVQINPAQVNGSAVAIWFQYTVQFEKRDGLESITLFPHQFFGIEGPGDNYIGPQRYDVRIFGAGGLLGKCTGSYLMWYGFVISAEGGKPLSVKTISEQGSANCKRFNQQRVEQGMYIPAFLNGVATEAPYREAWSDRPWTTRN